MLLEQHSTNYRLYSAFRQKIQDRVMVNSNNLLPTEILGLLACISDSIIVYDGYKVLYTNPGGYLLLQQTQNKLLEQLQLKPNDKHIRQLQLTSNNEEQNLIINCMPINWQEVNAYVAIIKNYSELVILPDTQAYEMNDEVIRNHFDLLLKSAGDGYWDWHIPTATVFFSASWLQMLGYEKHEIDPSFNTWINLIHPNDLGHFLVTWTDYMEKPSGNLSIEYRIRCHDNQYLWIEAHAIKELNNEGEIVHLAGFHRNIHQRKLDEIKLLEHRENLEALVKKRTLELEQANLKLLELANKDPLSQLQNRRSFDENLRQQLLFAKRANYPLCLLLMDIDHFKSFNDTYGHQQGDECIRAVAEAISSSTFRPGDFSARIGGEEFVAILQDTNLQGATKVAQRIQYEITQKDLPKNPHTGTKITLSIGIASNFQTSDSNILELADKAMYAAKRNGRNQLCYFSDNLESVSYIMNNSLL